MQAGGIAYVIRVPGQSSGAFNTVRSSSGSLLQVTQVRNFSTPISTTAAQAFLDTEQGPPVPVVRAEGSSDPNATFLEIGGDPQNRVYFERDPAQNLVLSVPGFEAPLNLYSDPASSVAVIIEFNQAVDPSDTNISDTRLRLEFLDRFGVWQPLETKVILVANCTETGARVRLDPIGILPQGSQLRAFVGAGLRDLVGESGLAPISNFAVTPTREVFFTSLNPADSGSDEFAESFDFGGTTALSFQDTTALFDAPAASWGSGRLSAAFSFQGTGGPGGTFDWLVRDGDRLVVDTDNGSITAADGITTQSTADGVIDVRNMTIELGGSVRVQGSRPLSINATGTVIIRGVLDASGFDAKDVLAINSGNQKEVGGTRGPGGGGGGDASEVVTNSTPRGSFGQGPGVLVNAGGQGGETGYAPANPKDARRPGGGAGGRFALDQGAGLVAQAGLPGNALATGAVSAQQPPSGGAVSSGPFVDGDSTNNFFGTKALGAPGNVTGLIRGELAGLWGGYGGGGGGNADPAAAFPTPNWTPASDEKGGAGGGGGGGLHIRALGPILFGDRGLIRCTGGRGAIGENVQQQDHIGGNGGSGSGGHVILETASFVDFTDAGAATGSRDCIDAQGGLKITGFEPAGADGFSDGGAGGPGVIQLHVPDSLRAPSNSSLTSDIVVPNGLGDPIDRVTSPPASIQVPAFGARSLARSKWISIGGADQRPTAGPALLEFLFQGVETTGTVTGDQGKVLVAGEEVQPLPALLDEDLEGNPNATVLADRLTLSLTGSSITTPFSGSTGGVSNQIYLRNPSLFEQFVLRLSVGATEQDFVVASASYSEGLAGAGDERLNLAVADEGTDLQDFINANTAGGTVHYRLFPRFFRVLTGGVENSLPSTAFVRMTFQGAQDNGLGAPDENNLLVDWTGDISQFSALPAGQLQFFRFEVEFELAANGGSVSADTQPIALDFLKIPFVF
ncbi:MAG: hypothetical protein EXS08_04970 [Planctomycetes bacterium]|nr:hypothetical protein [Planctomycetota bacterium]